MTTFYNLSTGQAPNPSPPDTILSMTQAQIAAMCVGAAWRPFS